MANFFMGDVDDYVAEYRSGLGRVLTGPASKLPSSVKKKLRSAAVARRVQAVTGMSQADVRLGTRGVANAADRRMARVVIGSKAKKGANKLKVANRLKELGSKLGYTGKDGLGAGIKRGVFGAGRTSIAARKAFQSNLRNRVVEAFGRRR
ncbi:MAG TPA: hypothetical protein V6C65_04320 [Allocoleopsis sp.]